LPLTLPKSTRLHDPGAELLAQFTDFWDRYGRIVLGALGVMVAGGAIAFLTLRARATSEEEAAGRLAEANALYWQGDYSRSGEMARQIAQQYSSTPSGIDAHRLAGDNAYWDGDFKTAITEYRAYMSRAPKGVLTDAARRSLAYALESSKQYADAASNYDALIGVFDRESSAEFLAAEARCYRALDRPQDAVRALQRLVGEFGETSHANAARIELAELSSPVH
jgi:tetratricopeptide (TPR) repeat protein